MLLFSNIKKPSYFVPDGVLLHVSNDVVLFIMKPTPFSVLIIYPFKSFMQENVGIGKDHTFSP
jgi:hypothetical protein